MFLTVDKALSSGKRVGDILILPWWSVCWAQHHCTLRTYSFARRFGTLDGDDIVHPLCWTNVGFKPAGSTIQICRLRRVCIFHPAALKSTAPRRPSVGITSVVQRKLCEKLDHDNIFSLEFILYWVLRGKGKLKKYYIVLCILVYPALTTTAASSSWWWGEEGIALAVTKTPCNASSGWHPIAVNAIEASE